MRRILSKTESSSVNLILSLALAIALVLALALTQAVKLIETRPLTLTLALALTLTLNLALTLTLTLTRGTAHCEPAAGRPTTLRGEIVMLIIRQFHAAHEALVTPHCALGTEAKGVAV